MASRFASKSFRAAATSWSGPGFAAGLPGCGWAPAAASESSRPSVMRTVMRHLLRGAPRARKSSMAARALHACRPSGLRVTCPLLSLEDRDACPARHHGSDDVDLLDDGRRGSG